MRPAARVGIHVPEAARDSLLGNPDLAYRTEVLPALRAYATLLRDRIPARFVTDAQLAQGKLDGLAALVLPDSTRLSAGQAAQVARFRRNGGLVLAAVPATPTALPPAVGDVRVRVSGGPETLHVGTFTDAPGRRTTVLLTPDFSWVRPVAPRHPLVAMEPPPAAVRDVVLHLAGGAPPSAVEEVVSGRKLVARRVSEGFEVRVPTFRILAAIAIRW